MHTFDGKNARGGEEKGETGENGRAERRRRGGWGRCRLSLICEIAPPAFLSFLRYALLSFFLVLFLSPPACHLASFFSFLDSLYNSQAQPRYDGQQIGICLIFFGRHVVRKSIARENKAASMFRKHWIGEQDAAEIQRSIINWAPENMCTSFRHRIQVVYKKEKGEGEM